MSEDWRAGVPGWLGPRTVGRVGLREVWSASGPEKALLDNMPEGYLLVAMVTLVVIDGSGVPVVVEYNSDEPRFEEVNRAFDRGTTVELRGLRCLVQDIAVEMRERAEYMKEIAARGRRTSAMHPSIWDEIRAERARQDADWGGVGHDDLHSPFSFLALVVKHVGKLAGLVGDMRREEDVPEIRRRLIVVAALVVAFIETLDRGRHRL